MLSETDKKILQVVLVVGLFSVVGLFYYSFGVVKDRVKRLNERINTTEKQIKEKETYVQDLREWQNRQADIQGLIQALNEEIKRLPTSIDERNFFQILAECIAKANLSDVKVTRPIGRGRKGKQLDLGAYVERPYRIYCKARYHDLGQFLMLIEQHRERIMRLKTLDVSNNPKRPSRHPVNMQVATYVFTRPIPE